MKPQRIILLRHGLSNANVDPLVYERTPDHMIALTAEGIDQARIVGQRIGEILKEESFGVFTSPYVRTLQTKDAMLRGIGRSPVFDYQDPSIREQEYGNMPTVEASEQNRASRNQIGRFFYRFPDGESCADVYDRMAIFMQSLFRRFERDSCPQNIIIVSHGTAIKCFLSRWYHWSVEKFDGLGLLPNCHVSLMTNESGSHGRARYKLSEPFSDIHYFGEAENEED